MFFFEKKVNTDKLMTLNHLIDNWENEVVEFKEANNDYDKDKIGKYFSAISNEANLKGLQFGWLVFGVRNKDKKICGSDYRDAKGLETLKYEISIIKCIQQREKRGVEKWNYCIQALEIKMKR